MTISNWIAVIGAPNVGKSTLVNALVGQKVSIVTPKPQTTRNIIRGIKIVGDAQLIFTDSPGIFAPRNELGKIMVKSAWQCLEGADQVCLVVDATTYSSHENISIIKTLKQKKLQYSLVLNKIDLVKKPDLLTFISFFNEQDSYKNIFLISSLKKDGLDKLFKFFIETAKPSPWPFQRDQITDAPLYFTIAEVIREQIFINTHEEIPYNVQIEIADLKEEQGRTIVHADILVRDMNHKKILVGAKAQMIKKIGTAARQELNKMLNKRFCLLTNVKILHK